MNSHQRRKARRSEPVPSGCGFQGYSNTTPYPDLMCTDGRMTDMDADGVDPLTWRPPCPKCNPAEYNAWLEELANE
jgi:hypothetical protein